MRSESGDDGAADADDDEKMPRKPASRRRARWRASTESSRAAKSRRCIVDEGFGFEQSGYSYEVREAKKKQCPINRLPPPSIDWGRKWFDLLSSFSFLKKVSRRERSNKAAASRQSL